MRSHCLWAACQARAQRRCAAFRGVRQGAWLAGPPRWLGLGEGLNERGRGREAGPAAVPAAAVQGPQDSAVALRWVGAGASCGAGMRPDVGKQVALPDCGQVPPPLRLQWACLRGWDGGRIPTWGGVGLGLPSKGRGLLPTGWRPGLVGICCVLTGHLLCT